MATLPEETTTETPPGMRYHSSLAEDVWHPEGRAPGAYEWWYFDAISDDGRDALVIIFLSNFVFSPRYNAGVARRLEDARAPADKAPPDFPAVAFCLYRDGRPLIRAVNEYGPADFAARTDRPSCRIGHSSFQLETAAAHSSRFVLQLDETLRRGRHLNARFEWLLTEGDFSHPSEGAPGAQRAAAHDWNMVAPRCRVSGALEVSAPRGGKRIMRREFDGTGYHDHNRDRRWMPATIAEWCWGRAHFADATAVFYHYRECDGAAHATKLFLVRDGLLSAYTARLVKTERRRHHFGVSYPRQLLFEADREGTHPTLLVRQRRVIDASFFYLRFLSDVTLLDTGSGQSRQAPAITEQLAPRALRWRWLDWLVNMRIGREGRGAFLH